MFLLHLEDPGACNLLGEPLLDSKIYNSTLIFLSGWAKKQSKLPTANIIQSLEAVPPQSLQGIILTAAVDQSKQYEILEYAKKNKILTVFIIDHIFNFQSCKKIIDKVDILLAASKAMNQTDCLELKHNIEIFSTTKKPHKIKEKVISSNKLKILFLSEPISQDYPESNFTEITLIHDIIKICQMPASKNISLKIRPHPRCNISKYDAFEFTAINTTISGIDTLDNDLCDADLVLGISTIALEHALELMIPSFQIILDDKINFLPTLPRFSNRIITSISGLKDVISGNISFEQSQFLNFNNANQVIRTNIFDHIMDRVDQQ